MNRKFYYVIVPYALDSHVFYSEFIGLHWFNCGKLMSLDGFKKTDKVEKVPEEKKKRSW